MYSVANCGSTERALLYSMSKRTLYSSRTITPNPHWITWDPAFWKCNQLGLIFGRLSDERACLSDSFFQVKPSWFGLHYSYTNGIVGHCFNCGKITRFVEDVLIFVQEMVAA